MKLYMKMVLLFSVMMLVTVAIFSSYSVRLNFESFSDLSNLQYVSISHTVSEALNQQISLMDLVLEELLDNASFMAALNQFVRDDSGDQKMATAARNIVLQQLYRSPLVENFYRVSFYTREGEFVTSRPEKDDYLASGTKRRRRSFPPCPGWTRRTAPLPAVIFSPPIRISSPSGGTCRYTALCGPWYTTGTIWAIWRSATNSASWKP